jgi:hypothetical protein
MYFIANSGNFLPRFITHTSNFLVTATARITAALPQQR